MKNYLLLLLALPLYTNCERRAVETLLKYKDFLQEGTYAGADWSTLERIPASRYETFKMVFEHFERINGKVIVELGTSRSYVHGGLIGCNTDDKKYWTPNEPKNWDWGAGFFTGIAAECLQHLNPEFHTIDIERAHIQRCKHMTKRFKDIMQYHVCSSLDFLRDFPAGKKIDLLYIDTGDMTPIEPTAQLQLAEAKIIVERGLLSDNGIILIDDVRNQTPKKFGETSEYGKAKYSLAYFVEHGYEIVADEYQVVLKRK